MTTDSTLSGVAVLDLTQIMAGPFCTMVLADMGADVIKVERPNGGDDQRRMGPPFIKDWSAGFLALNRNKRSLVLDLRSESGQAVFKRLVEDVDVVVENFRPGVMDRLGLGYETLTAIKTSLVYCSISGYGNTGLDIAAPAAAGSEIDNGSVAQPVGRQHMLGHSIAFIIQD